MNHASHFLELILGTIVALLPLINPLSAAPTFLAITEGDSEARREQQLRAACFYMVGILVSFLIGGSFLMGFFGISIPGLRIAGGLLVAGIGSGMLLPKSRDDRASEQEHRAARAKRDIAFSPLAMPMLSGPGAIAVTLGFTSLATHWLDYVAIILGIVSVALFTYFSLRLSGKVVLVMGVHGMNALTKIMGFLLLCVGIQFVVNGVLGIATDPVVLHKIRDALQGK